MVVNSLENGGFPLFRWRTMISSSGSDIPWTELDFQLMWFGIHGIRDDGTGRYRIYSHFFFFFSLFFSFHCFLSIFFNCPGGYCLATSE